MKAPKILLIDDEAPFVKNIAEILTLKGYDVSSALNGEEGLRAIREERYDVVILDLRMPVVSGMEVLRGIMPDSKKSPEVIILTGFATVDSAMEGLNHGAFDYLTKPIKIKDLLERITAALERKARKEL